MDEAELKRRVQALFADGLVTIVGSGVSVGLGLPSMGDLADRLLREMPRHVDPAQWEPYARRISVEKQDLETAFADLRADSPLLEPVVEIVASAVSTAEKTLLTRLAREEVDLPFSRLALRHLPCDHGATVITTNYDRLVEVACETEGLAVDTLFDGAYCGSLNATRSAAGLKELVPAARGSRLRPRPHVRVLKPHGSLDWRRTEQGPVRSLIDFGVPPLIITPGPSKYQRGYETPFEQHRSAANEAVLRARSFLILGFGFNDDHLQHSMQERLASGVPGLFASRTLSRNAQELLA